MKPALELPPHVPAPPTPSAELQELWFAVQARPWSSLAVLPTHSLGTSEELARELVAVGHLASPGQVELIDATGAGLEDTARLLAAIRNGHGGERRLVLALESALYNQVSIPLARAADAVLLSVDLGSDLASAQRTLELISPDRVIGCAAVRPGGRR